MSVVIHNPLPVLNHRPIVANWKLGRDKTKLSSHRTSRQDITAKTKHVSFEIFSDSLDLSPIQFKLLIPTRQDKTVIYNVRKRTLMYSPGSKSLIQIT